MNNFSPSSLKPPSTNHPILVIFNYIGAALIFFGVAYFIGTNWYSLNNFVKIFATLGSAVAAYIIGILLSFDERFKASSSGFFMISGLFFPMGIYIVFQLYGNNQIDFDIINIIVMGICFLVFLFSYLKSPRTIFLLYTLIFVTLLFDSILSFLSMRSSIVYNNLLEYSSLAVGCSYILLGRYFDFDKQHPLTGVLYFFGALSILSASYCLGGFFYYDGFTYWKILTAFIILLSFVLSVPLKSKSLLYLAAFFFILYIMDMSSKYIDVFGDYGWPLMLILSGLFLIFIGYFVFYMHKKINKSQK